jgi:hypothetical protein
MGIEDDVKETTNKFPFLMVLTSTFLRGAIFLILNVPLIVIILQQKTMHSIYELFKDGIFTVWHENFKTESGLFTFSAFIIICLIAGTIITPFDRIFSTIIMFMVSRINSLFKRHPLVYFSTANMLNSEYAEFLSWLFRNQVYKSHWEWELFNFYNAWCISANVTLFVLLILIVLGNSLTISYLFLILLICIVLLFFSIHHSLLMGKVQAYYANLFSKRQIK